LPNCLKLFFWNHSPSEREVMMKPEKVVGIIVVAVLAIMQGCVAPQPSPDLLAPTEAQMKIRSMQTRSFDVKDRQMAMRGVIAALQDLGFIIERANEPLGLVTAARFAEPNFYDVVGVTVTVRTEDEGRMMIRANAIYNNKPIEDPKVYQNFFAALERSLFVTKN
jgi:hypothetical protein